MTDTRSLFSIGTRRLAPLLRRTPPVWLGIIFLVLVSAVQLLWPLLHLPFHVARTINEGWNAVHTAQAMRGETIYPAHDSFMFNNYPPLSFYIVGLAGGLIGDAIVAGRIISLLAVLVVAVNVALTVRNLGGTAPCAVFAGVLFVAILTKSFMSCVGINEPQLLAHAVMTTGFTIFTAAPQRPRHLAAAALTMVLAGFIKHNIFAMPLAATTWLLHNDRRALVRWMAYALAFLGLGFAACGSIYRGAFFEQLLAPRHCSLDNVIALLGWTQYIIIPLVLWLVSAVQVRPDPHIRAVSHLLVAGGIAYVVTRAGDGVSVNALFDWVIGASIAAGVLLSRVAEARFSRRYGPEMTRGLIVTALCLRTIVLPQHEIMLLLHKPAILAELRAKEAAWGRDIAFMQRQKGPALCQDLALCYWSGHQAAYDEFNAEQAVLTGARDLDSLKRQIMAGRYRVLQLGPELKPLVDAARAAGFKERLAANRGVIFTMDDP
jgi:hypothetical protein